MHHSLAMLVIAGVSLAVIVTSVVCIRKSNALRHAGDTLGEREDYSEEHATRIAETYAEGRFLGGVGDVILWGGLIVLVPAAIWSMYF